MITRWDKLSRDQIAALDKDQSVVLVPLGSTEQHGAHLPVGTDSIILDALVEKIISDENIDGNILFTPTMRIGKSNEHMHFAGTLTYKATTYYNVIYDYVSSIAKHGFKKVILFNSHGGNTDMCNLISRDLRIDLNIEVYVIDWWFTDFWQDGLKDIRQSGTYGVFHACELETSLMLAICPELVDMSKAVDEDPKESLRDNDVVTVFGPVNAGWKTEDVTQSGVIGAPTFATAEKGNKLMDYASKKISNIITHILHMCY